MIIDQINIFCRFSNYTCSSVRDDQVIKKLKFRSFSFALRNIAMGGHSDHEKCDDVVVSVRIMILQVTTLAMSKAYINHKLIPADVYGLFYAMSTVILKLVAADVGLITMGTPFDLLLNVFFSSQNHVFNQSDLISSIYWVFLMRKSLTISTRYNHRINIYYASAYFICYSP